MPVKKVVITELIDNCGVELLKQEAAVAYLPELPGRALADEIKDADALVVRVAKIDSALLESAKNLVVIAKHGVGYDNIDVAAATGQKILVVSTPEANAESVAEHNLGLMLSLSKKISFADRSLRQNRPQPRGAYTGVELKDKKLGVIGLGRIGSELAHKCQAAFNTEVIVYDPYVSEEKASRLGYRKVNRPDDLLVEADYVIICVPLTKETANLIGKKELDLMKPDAFLINSSRGGIIDEDALYQHLVDSKIAGAALDVFQVEPPPPEHPLLSLDNFIATPHIGGMTAEAMRRMALTLAEDVISVFRGEKPRFPVNLEVLP
jgi:D-3-phosphoglycerate dehydrogenase